MNEARLRTNWEAVRQRVADAASKAGRELQSVRLVAVTKRSSAEVVRGLVIACGASDLGENYPQELWRKAEALGGLSVRWHLIGHLQSNKARRTLPLVTMVHSVDSLKLLSLLDELAAELPTPPGVCLQVNASDEATKHGWSADGILADAEAIAAYRKIPVAGLMTMAAPGPDAESARPSFVRLRATRDALRARTGLALPELSMGMSGDYEVAIEEGATLVRMGSALFEGVES
jgi:pyridoxal phosphate enzyme (YggS family)